MADPVPLKFPPEQKGAPPSPARKLAAEPRRRLMAGLRRYRRVLLLVVLPLVAALAGITFYLNGGRYVTTDDAYVGAQKVLITFDVSGKIVSVAVKEGQLVTPGDTEALTGALNTALALDKPALETMGETGMAHVRQEYTTERMCSRTLDVYEAVLTRYRTAMRQEAA